MRRALTTIALVASTLPACQCSEPLHTNPTIEKPSRPTPDEDPGVGDVEGVLCNAHIGDVVRDAQVRIVLEDESVIEDRTDDDGHFVLRDVPEGQQVLQAIAPTFHRTQVIEVVKDDVVEVDIGGACGLPVPGEEGAVQGRVCSPDGGTWLVDATASITLSPTEVVTDQTDVDGRYLLEHVPSGPQTLVIEKGSFRSELSVDIPAGGVLTLPDDNCQLETDELRIAVVRGSQYDHVENVLSNIGVDITTLDIYDGDWAETLLGADERVRDYDILFLNCRSAEPVYVASPEMQQRLRDYVRDGGSLHASDQAYDLIEVTWPDKIDFLGDDALRGQADQGAIADVTATVVDDNLAAGLGRDTATLHYALETWSTMTAVADDVDVYLTADSPLLNGTTLTDVPQIVGFHDGEGRVLYSSFHQEPGSNPDQVTILELLMFEL